MNILALDLGTKTGWALHQHGGHITGGTERHMQRRSDTPGTRWVKFRQQLFDHQRQAGEIHAIYYEDVKNHAGIYASHIYGGYLAILEVWSCIAGIPLRPVGVGTVKKHWTGSGRADKAQMIAEAKRRGFAPVDDNHADALAILAYGLDAEGLVRQPIGMAA